MDFLKQQNNKSRTILLESLPLQQTYLQPQTYTEHTFIFAMKSQPLHFVNSKANNKTFVLVGFYFFLALYFVYHSLWLVVLVWFGAFMNNTYYMHSIFALFKVSSIRWHKVLFQYNSPIRSLALCPCVLLFWHSHLIFTKIYSECATENVKYCINSTGSPHNFYVCIHRFSSVGLPLLSRFMCGLAFASDITTNLNLHVFQLI